VLLVIRVNDHHAITVVTPTIAPRAALLAMAAESVYVQDLSAFEHIIEEDRAHVGAPLTRHAGLMRVDTAWTAFLDDDDLLMPQHLEHLYAHAVETGADYVYSWFQTLPDGCDPFPSTHFTEPYDPANPVATTITVLVRTELAQEVGFSNDNQNPRESGEDWAFQMGCQAAGGKISHLVERTWYWRHWGVGSPERQGNTSGLGSRW
jgi:hypothetical protein